MRNFIRNILKRYGYDIVKTGVPYIPGTKKDVMVRVGKYEVLMPGNNVQLINYQLYPDMNGQLGRLAALVHAKYPDGVIADVGANVGDTIAVVKSAVNAAVIGIEGDEKTYSYLEKNVAQFKDVVIVKTFLSDTNKKETVSFEKDGWNATIIPGSEGGNVIDFRTFDDVAEKSITENRNIKLLKTDVEGFDTIVIRGAMATIQKCKPVLFFEYNRENMKAINEDGISTIFSLATKGYKKILFFDHKGNFVTSTDIQNSEVVNHLHDYISSSRNLMGYYDICIFHESDEDLANRFIAIEKEQLA